MSNPEELVETTFDDQALFDEADTDEPANPQEPQPQPEPEPQPEPKPEPTAELTAEKPPIPPKPEWRKQEDAERARAAEAELANERAEKAALKLRLEAMERASKPAPAPAEKPVKPDPLIDPEGYEAYLERKFEERRLATDRENSLRLAARTYKDEFKEAYAAAQQNIDPALQAMMQQSDDPGETLIAWHRDRKTKAEIGNDLGAFKQRLREESLKDPEFRKAAIAAWQAEAQPTTNGRPNVDLPPSLSSVSRSNASLSSTVGNDLSDEGLWEHANA